MGNKQATVVITAALFDESGTEVVAQARTEDTHHGPWTLKALLDQAYEQMEAKLDG